MNEQRPDFIYPPGSVLMHSPLVLTQADMYGFSSRASLPIYNRVSIKP